MCYHILHIIHNDFSCLELKGNSEREKSSNLKRIFEIIRHPCISIVVLFLLSYNSTSFFLMVVCWNSMALFGPLWEI